MVDERGQPPPVVLEGAAALRVGEQDPEAPDAELEEQVLEALRQLAVGRLHQQVMAALAERDRAKLLIARVMRPQEIDLAACDQLDLQPLPRRRGRELGGALAELGWDDVRMIGPDVGRRGQRDRALVRRRGEHVERAREFRRAVVDAREDVGVEVDQHSGRRTVVGRIQVAPAGDR